MDTINSAASQENPPHVETDDPTLFTPRVIEGELSQEEAEAIMDRQHQLFVTAGRMGSFHLLDPGDAAGLMALPLPISFHEHMQASPPDDSDYNEDGDLHTVEIGFLIDRRAVAEHLAFLAPKAETFAFASYTEKPWLGKDPECDVKERLKTDAGEVNQPLADVADKLDGYQNRRAAVYVAVNAMRDDATSSTKEDIERVRVLYLDLDDPACDIEAIKACSLPVHRIVESSPGKYHVYWRVDGLTVAEVEGYARFLVKHYFADKGVWDTARVLRLPGTWNLKRVPFMTRVVYTADDLTPYSIAKIDAAGIEWLPEKTKAKAADYIPPSNVDPEKLVELVNGDDERCLTLWNAERQDFTNGGTIDGSAYHFAIAGEIKRCRLPIEVYDVYLRAWVNKHPDGDRQDKINRPGYIATTWNKNDMGWMRRKGESWKAWTARREAVLALFTDDKITDDEPYLTGAGGEGNIPVIRITSDLSCVVQQACAVLAGCENLYVKDGLLFILKPSVPVAELSDGTPEKFERIDRYGLQVKLSEVADWEKFDKRAKEKWVPTKPPLELAANILSSPDMWGSIKRIDTFSASPMVMLDGTIRATHGYHADINAYIDMTGWGEIDPTPETGKAAAKRALADLFAPLEKFPFASPADEAAMVALMLTPPIRASIRTAPFYIIDAPIAGTGKSKLAEFVSILATGRVVTADGYVEDIAEQRKRMTATLLAGSTYLFFDNVDKVIGSDVLDRMATTGAHRDRVMGLSKEVDLRARVTAVFTGNNVRVKNDTSRRFIKCRIDANCEKPRVREFDFDPIEVIQKDPAKFMQAAIVILASFIGSGDRVECTPFGSFEAWSRYVRECVLWLGLPDPCDTTEELEADVAEEDALEPFLQAWHDLHGSKWVTAKELSGEGETGSHVDKLQESKTPLKEALRALVTSTPGFERSHGLVTKTIGKLLSHYKGQVRGNLKLTKAEKQHRRVWLYRVDYVEEKRTP